MVDGTEGAETGEDTTTQARPDTSGSPRTKPAGGDRRKSPRVSVDLPATVKILVEEMTFSPFEFECVCQNISRSGALVIVRDLRKDHYVQLIRKPRFVRIGFIPPGREKQIMLFGKLIWFDFQETPGGTICKLASSFEPMKDEVIEELNRYLDYLASQPADG